MVSPANGNGARIIEKWTLIITTVGMVFTLIYSAVYTKSDVDRNKSDIKELNEKVLPKTEIETKLSLRDQQIISLQKNITRVETKLDKVDESVDDLGDDVKQVLYEMKRSRVDASQ